MKQSRSYSYEQSLEQRHSSKRGDREVSTPIIFTKRAKDIKKWVLSHPRHRCQPDKESQDSAAVQWWESGLGFSRHDEMHQHAETGQ